MMMKMCVLDKQKKIRANAEGKDRITLVYTPSYKRGDTVVFRCRRSGWYHLCLDDGLPSAMVYVEKEASFPIPFGEKRICYPPRAFKGRRHLITAFPATEEEVYRYRNLALNPLDHHGDTGMFPHAEANVETRGEAVFAAHNAIDGIYANRRHHSYPYQSWGINKDPNASCTIDFGCMVELDKIALTLRADFPHDSYWTQATVAFSDGSEEVFSLQKSAETQWFAIEKRRVNKIVLKNLIKAENFSPFPALTQIEAWGRVVSDK